MPTIWHDEFILGVTDDSVYFEKEDSHNDFANIGMGPKLKKWVHVALTNYFTTLGDETFKTL